MSDLFKLTGKVALVVGGGQGLGEASARYLADVGCAIAVVDRETERARAVVQTLTARGVRAVAITANILEVSEIERVVAETEAALGGLDIVVSIVGASKFGGVLELSEAEWDHDHDRNLRYFFFLCQAAARSFVRRDVKGVIIGVATAGVNGSMPFRSAYGAAKAGLVHLVRTLAVELGEWGIRINAVAPGLTVTPRTQARVATEAAQAQIRNIPRGRAGTPDDIGKAVLFLASDLADHITGTTVPVDGGSTVTPSYDLGPSRAASKRNRVAMGKDPLAQP